MSQQIYKSQTKQIRISAIFHKLLKIEAARKNKTIKKLVEEKAGWDTPPIQAKQAFNINEG